MHCAAETYPQNNFYIFPFPAKIGKRYQSYSTGHENCSSWEEAAFGIVTGVFSTNPVTFTDLKSFFQASRAKSSSHVRLPGVW